MSSFTDPSPAYDPSQLDEFIRELEQQRASDPAAHDVGDELLGTLKLSQLDSLSNEINTSMQDTLTLQKNLTNILQALGRLQDRSKDSAATPILSKFQTCCEIYSKLLWKGRELATASAGARGLDGFVNVLVRGILQDEEAPDEAVVAELENFIKNLPSAQAPDAEFSFPSLEKLLGNVVTMIEEKLSQPNPSPEKVRVKTLESNLRQAKLNYARLLPAYLAALGIDEDAPLLLIIIGLAPLALINAVRGQRKRTGDNGITDTVVKAYNRIQELTDQLNTARQGLKNSQSHQKGIDVQWTVAMIDILTAKEKLIDKIEPSLSVLGRIQNLLRRDCEDYLNFIKGPDSQDSAAKAKLSKRLEESSKLYEHLRDALNGFANAVVPP